MFVGHYSVSFAAKSLEPRIPLWVLFIAVQLADVFWSVFVWAGIEKVRIVPGITASNPLDLYYMPYTHSLLAAVLWGLAATLAYRWWRRGQGARAAALVGIAVFSHWVLDLVVHRPDLPLYDNTAKVGLGLWDYPALAFTLEAALLFGGIVWYLRTSRANAPIGRYGMLVYGVLLLAVHATVFFGAPPESPAIAAAMALGSYAMFAGIVAWLERSREPRSA